MDPIFAVIIPVYNGQEYIADCLNSLVSQSYKHWIAICVNDGSTDNTEKIIEKYASNDPRINLISKENGGVSSARNAALDYLSNLKYDWISFLDADDMLGVDNLSNLKEIICKNPKVDYIRTHCKSYQDRKEMISDAATVHPHTSVIILNSNQYFNNEDVGGLTHSCHISRTLFENNTFLFPIDMKILEDQVFSIKYALKAECIAVAYSTDYMYFTPPICAHAGIEKYPNSVSDTVRCINYVYESLLQSSIKPDYFDRVYFPAKINSLLTELAMGHKIKDVSLCSSINVWRYCKSFKAKIRYLIARLRFQRITGNYHRPKHS